MIKLLVHHYLTVTVLTPGTYILLCRDCELADFFVYIDCPWWLLRKLSNKYQVTYLSNNCVCRCVEDSRLL